MVGDGPELARLREIVEQSGIAEHIEFAGKISDVAPYLARAKLFVLPSMSEGVSIAMLEALMCGLPVVVSDVGDLRDFVGPRTGVLIEHIEPSVVARHIAGLLESDVKMREMAQNSRELALESFSVDAIARAWYTII